MTGVPAGQHESAASETNVAARRFDGFDKLVDADAVAAMLSVPKRWVREHTRSGAIPHVPLGRYVRYRPAAVIAWVFEQEQGGAPWRKHKPKTGR